jgi:hypothetical protein
MVMSVYAPLCLVVFLEAVLLRELLRRTMLIKRQVSGFDRPLRITQLPVGALAPNFSAPVLGTSQTVNRSKLKGHPSILLFISPKNASPSLYRNLVHVIHAMWHQVKGQLYLVCIGLEEPCHRLVIKYRLTRWTPHGIAMMLDPASRIAHKFLISKLPQAVELDEKACVKRYGSPSPMQERSRNGSGRSPTVVV